MNYFKECILILFLFLSCIGLGEWRFECSDESDPNTCRWIDDGIESPLPQSKSNRVPAPCWRYLYDANEVLWIDNPDSQETWMSVGTYYRTIDYNLTVRRYSQPEFLKQKITALWLTEMNLRDFALFAKHWKGEPKPEPQPVKIPMVWTALNSDVFHWYSDCRYWRDTMAYVGVFDAILIAKRPCSICQKRKDTEIIIPGELP